MGKSIRLIYEAPNIENTIPVSLYQSSSPEKFSIEDDDKFVLYGGGVNFKLQIHNDDPSHELRIHHELYNIQNSIISLYVLNTSLVIWFDNIKRGLELSYQSIILHALKDPHNNPSLYLQIISSEYLESISTQPTDFTSSVELIITANNDEHSLGNTNPLFSVQKQSSFSDIYDALSECSSFHYDSDDSDEQSTANQEHQSQQQQQQQQALEIPSDWLNGSNMHDAEDVPLNNVGDADDLEIDEPQDLIASDEISVAGMNVDVGFASILGNVRKRDNDEDEDNNKSRRLN